MSNNPSQATDDCLTFVEESGPAQTAKNNATWRVLVVDDDDDMHETTRFALNEVTIHGRPIELLHAYSAKEARAVVARNPDIAVALIDVVMETPHAGLGLVRALRDAGQVEMRIVLRTGQPGYAPELSAISTYEIDDYRTKSELTRTRLLTVLTATIRAYDQVCTINRSRVGLEMVVHSATELMKRRNLELFSRGILMQIASLLGIPASGIVCITATDGDAGRRVISAVGRLADMIGLPISELDAPEFQALLDATAGSAEPVIKDGYMAVSFVSKTGSELAVVLQSDCEIARPDLDLMILFTTNIAVAFDNLALVEKLDHLAYVDSDLGIANLNAFQRSLQEMIATQVPDARMALLSVDAYNEVLGTYGDEIARNYLKAVCTRVEELGGADVKVARVADRTLALLADREGLHGDLLDRVMNGHLTVGGVEIPLTGTSVILDIDDPAPAVPDIMRKANAALTHTRHVARGECVTFDTGMQGDVDRRAHLQTALASAMEHGDGLSVYLQPKFDMSTGDVTGAEALLRWKIDDEFISPAEFIPIAEATGRIRCLTDFVLDTVGAWARRRPEGPKVPVAVNLSMTDLNRPDFAARLLLRLSDSGLSPDSLAFEVTEGIAMQNPPWAIDQLHRLRSEGFKVALDDFGTGFSSLSYFDRLPIDTLKIDRSFVSQLDIRTARESLAAVVLAMTQTLGVESVAEGVESLEQRQALDFLGCNVAQGFFFGRPVPIDDFDGKFLAQAAQ